MGAVHRSWRQRCGSPRGVRRALAARPAASNPARRRGPGAGPAHIRWGEQSTQAAFGRILLDLAKSGAPLAARLVTTSPDVAVSTNLGGWVNQRGLFRRSAPAGGFRAAKIPSAQRWHGGDAGQHIELGIAENNLFLMLAALGLAGPLFGTRLLPVGTVYDPFIACGLDVLNYGCYQDAHFLLVATPSGLTLAPEGGAPQSINTPLSGMGQPGLTAFEPAFADELAALMGWAFAPLQEDEGGSAYLRLSTRPIRQIHREDGAWREGMLEGGYWLRPPRETHAVAYMGAVAPEALEAWTSLTDEMPGLGLLAITSPDRLHRGWSQAQARQAEGDRRAESHVEALLAPLGRQGRIVTLLDGSPAALSWLGAVHGQRVHPLGVDSSARPATCPTSTVGTGSTPRPWSALPKTYSGRADPNSCREARRLVPPPPQQPASPSLASSQRENQRQILPSASRWLLRRKNACASPG